MSSLVDSHCHIPLLAESLPVQAILDNAAEQGIEKMLCVAIDLEGVPAIIDLARQHASVAASSACIRMRNYKRKSGRMT